ncbi:hypothetical protein I63B_0302905 [Aggregatibacter actinomycetemcomitans serotype d str. I63B]|nr:hypothetical protein I63B_0302905 [Aggregatibacter actinomycetemcomitans serotype d str. I63B]
MLFLKTTINRFFSFRLCNSRFTGELIMAKRIFIILIVVMLPSCFLLVKSTKYFPDLKIACLSTGYYITKNYKGNEHRVPSLEISSNIDIEDEALKQGLTITNKDLLCVFDKKLLKNSDIPNSYRTIGGGQQMKINLKEVITGFISSLFGQQKINIFTIIQLVRLKILLIKKKMIFYIVSM